MLLGLRVPTYVRGGRATEFETISSFAKKAEHRNFHSLWVMDHILAAKPAQDYSFLDPLVCMTAMASVTTRIRVGASVIILPLRNPVLLAKEVATMDWLSGGRIELGIGTGWLKSEFDALQVPFSSRGRRINESLEILTRLWTEDEVSHDGESFKLDRVSIDPKPVQKPYPTISIGGGSVPNPKPGQGSDLSAVFRRIGRYATRWHASSVSNLDLIRRDFDRISGYAREYGRDPQGIQIWQTAYMYVAKDRAEAEKAYKEFTGKELTPSAAASGYLVGGKEEILDKIVEREKFGVKGMVFSPLTYNPDQVDVWYEEILSQFA